jgi:hypothetical protein
LLRSGIGGNADTDTSAWGNADTITNTNSARILA